MIRDVLAELWRWFSSSSPAQIVAAIGALVVALRTQSNHEHRKSMRELKSISAAVNGKGTDEGLTGRIERLERATGLRE